jgi:hypothetical protein
MWLTFLKITFKKKIKPTIFVYNELKVPTKDFNPTMKLGEGSFGVVYKIVVLTHMTSMQMKSIF